MSAKRPGDRAGRRGAGRDGDQVPQRPSADDSEDWFLDPDVTADLGAGGRGLSPDEGATERISPGELGGADPLEGTQRFTLPERPRVRGKKDRAPAPPRDRRAEREARRRERDERRQPASLLDDPGWDGAPDDHTTVLGDDLPLPPRRLGKERRPAWQRVGMAVAAVGVLLLVLAGGLRLIYSGRALPGTQVGALSVGGKNEAEVRAAVERLTDPERRISMTGASKTIRASAGGAGLQPDISATTEAVMEAGRGSLLSPIMAVLRGNDVDLVATIDSSALRGTIARVAGELDRRPYAGALQVDPDSLLVETRASESGREVDRSELSRRLQAELLEPTDGPVRIPITTTEAVSAARVSEVADQAEKYLKQPLIAKGAGKAYEITPQALAPILQLQPLDGGREAQLGVDPDATALVAKRIADARDKAARNASFSAPSTGVTVDGKDEVSWKPRAASVTVVAEARNGLAIDQERLVGRIRNAVREGKHEVKVPSKVVKPAVTSKQADAVDHLIGTFTTYYEPGQPRVTNIQRIARSVDRTVIGPKQQFSLNGISGERTKDKGYVEAPFIANNKIEPSVGGGVSQFSTTMYNAAYFAGLQIDAFMPHSLFIARYPAGRESTLNFPDIDMKWTNDTGAPVLIRTAADDTSVTVRLYGDNGGRRVKAIPGEREPNPGGNFKITVTREIRYPDGKVVRQPHTTSYANEDTTPDAQE